MRRFAVLFAVVASIGFISGCEDEDDNKIAQAQECLDNGGNPQTCIDMVDGIDKPEAQVIRCAGRSKLGGLDSDAILQAYKNYEDAVNGEKEETLIVGLSQTDDTFASSTLNACQKTDVPSLIWISALSRLGTLMVDGGGPGTPNQIATACCNTGTGTICSDATAGQMVNLAFNTYCIGDAEKNDVCQTLKTAIQSGNSSAQVGMLLYCALAL